MNLRSLALLTALGKNLGLSEIEVFPHRPPEHDFVAWVDPTIETTRGRWFFCVPGSRPFGLVSAAPYTRNKNQWGGGYNYNSTEILGFSQVHCWIMSGVNLMPTAGDLNPCAGEHGWKSSFSHDSEILEPGYQRVFLDRYGLWVEMTCTDRVALYRITPTEDVESNVLLSLGGWLGSVSMIGAEVEPRSNSRLVGSVGTTGRLWGGPEFTRVFFVIDFDRPYSRLAGWQGQERIPNLQRLAVPVAPERIARNRDYWFQNPPEEQAGVAVGHRLQAGDDLWHTLLGRHKLDDASGDYPIYMDPTPNPRSNAPLRIHRLPHDAQGNSTFHMYNSDAFWLTQWNLNVLWGLGWPELLDNFAASLVRYADHGGALPRGPSAGGYTFIMTGSPATSLITAAYQKGLLRKVDVEHAYQTMKRNHLPGGGMGVDTFYVFNHAHHPWLAQYWVRQVNEAAYGGITPDVGYGGHDEDQGQMGGLSALMSLGLFSVRGTCSADPIYEITAPVFDEIEIRLDPRYYAGESFRIKTYNNATANLYIQRAALNGAPLENCWFYHRDFAQGGLLELWLGPEPNRAWGRSPLPQEASSATR